MESDKTIVIIAVVALLSVTSCAAYSSHNTREKVRLMTEKGYDPLDIPCAADTATERYCEMRAATREKK